VSTDAAPGTRELSALRCELPGLPIDADGAVFKAPWEAQAFAMALALHERGEFTWKEWVLTLAEVIGEVKDRGEADTGDDYYRHWLAALERIATRNGIVTDAMLQRRRRQWDEAARRTPHGMPIEL
jgi:nitrile hydratase accessory protein